MKMFKNILMPADYLGEKCSENANGKLSFSTTVCRNFCDTYTDIDYDMLGVVEKELLKNRMYNLACLNRFPGMVNLPWDGKKLDIQII